MKMPATPSRVLETVSDERAFRFSHGGVARSLEELERALREAPAGPVWFHREHLVPWVRDVLGDEPLARRYEHYAQAHMDADVLRDALADLAATRLSGLRARA